MFVPNPRSAIKGGDQKYSVDRKKCLPDNTDYTPPSGNDYTINVYTA
jgi:hypothetical protein